MAYFAWHENKKKAAKDVNSGDKGYCTLSGESMVACKGELRQYWRYINGKPDLPRGYENETPWHAAWKSLVRDDRVEVHSERDGVKHRADILGSQNKVIEIQRSPLEIFDVRERGSFYRREYGQGNPDYRLTWVVNLNGIWQKSLSPLTKKVPGVRNQFEVDWKNKRHWVYEMAANRQHDLFVDFNPTNPQLLKMWVHQGKLKASYFSKERFFMEYMNDVAKPECNGFSERAQRTIIEPKKSDGFKPQM